MDVCTFSPPLAGEKSFQVNNDPTDGRIDAVAPANRLQSKLSEEGPSFGSCVAHSHLFLEWGFRLQILTHIFPFLGLYQHSAYSV